MRIVFIARIRALSEAEIAAMMDASLTALGVRFGRGWLRTSWPVPGLVTTVSSLAVQCDGRVIGCGHSRKSTRSGPSGPARQDPVPGKKRPYAPGRHDRLLGAPLPSSRRVGRHVRSGPRPADRGRQDPTGSGGGGWRPRGPYRSPMTFNDNQPSGRSAVEVGECLPQRIAGNPQKAA